MHAIVDKLGFFLLALATTVSTTHTVMGQQWGSLTRRFQLSGEVPTVNTLPVTKDLSYCEKYKSEIFDESLVVGKKGGLTNLCIWLRIPRGASVPIHPAYDKPLNSVHMKAHHCKFQPRAVALWAGHRSRPPFRSQHSETHRTRIWFPSTTNSK